MLEKTLIAVLESFEIYCLTIDTKYKYNQMIRINSHKV